MSRTCQGITKAATRCKLPAKRGKKFCHLHLTVSDISSTPDQNFRDGLQGYENDRETFIGSFKRIGSKPGGLTILLTNIRSPKDKDVILADHAWFNFTKGFSELGHLVEGDDISFTARVKRYEKGYGANTKTFDYKFSIPLNVSRETR